MSSSRVLWSSPQINRNRKLNNAKLLHDTSMQSLKFQIIFFVAIMTEICLNLLLKLFGGANPPIYIYMLICKTFLAINIIFIISYVYQIVVARIRMYLDTMENKDMSLIKSILFELFPQMKHYYEKLIKCRWLSPWLLRETIEQERIKAKFDEERRKTLYKMYFPNLHSQHLSYRDVSIKRDMAVSTDTWYSGTNQESLYKNTLDNVNFNVRPLNTSTPYSRRTTLSSFHEDITHLQSPIQTQMCASDSHMNSFTGPNSLDGVLTKYQTSPPNSSLSFINNRNQADNVSEVSYSDVWMRLGIDNRNLDQWTVNIKQWLHATIINRVAQEIEKLNQQFVQFGVPDIVIGESSVQNLRQLSVTQHGRTSFPSLSILINFIDCCKDQGYVVNRIKELSQGSSLGKYQWQSGSTSVRHPWKEHLPNDTALILHLLSAYIDSRVNPNLHGVRPFSQQFIIDSKDPGDLRDTIALLQSSMQPPHFKVVINQIVYDIGSGRKNMFECLLVFFYKVYKDEGNLKWLNLGRSGLNLNWIFDETNE